jgi:hypothetical protein
MNVRDIPIYRKSNKLFTCNNAAFWRGNICVEGGKGGNEPLIHECDETLSCYGAKVAEALLQQASKNMMRMKH